MSALENFRSAVILCFSGIGVLLSLVISAYVLTVILDRLSCFNDSSDILTPQELEERRTASSLSRRAGIAGILTEERLRIFRRFFEKRSMPYKKISSEEKTEKDDNDNDIEAQKNGTSITQTVESDAGDVAKDSKGSDENGGEDAVKGDTEQVTETTQGTCSICLNEYSDGDKVMTGTKCSHMFHYDCCMQWVEKGNDHCPYCREDMLTADELLEAAKEELGEERIEKMIRINQDAARRLAAMQNLENGFRQETTSASSSQVNPATTNTAQHATDIPTGDNNIAAATNATTTTEQAESDGPSSSTTPETPLVNPEHEASSSIAFVDEEIEIATDMATIEEKVCDESNSTENPDENQTNVDISPKTEATPEEDSKVEESPEEENNATAADDDGDSSLVNQGTIIDAGVPEANEESVHGQKEAEGNGEDEAGESHETIGKNTTGPANDGDEEDLKNDNESTDEVTPTVET